MDDILGFDGEYRWLSNFFPSEVAFDDVLYPSVEHAYQAAKVEPENRHKFLEITAGQAKRLGRKLPMRSEWEDIKIMVMYELLEQKFIQPSFREKLRETGDARIEETNNWGDTFWGVCDGEGKNVLGELIMVIRTFLFTTDPKKFIEAAKNLSELLSKKDG